MKVSNVVTHFLSASVSLQIITDQLECLQECTVKTISILWFQVYWTRNPSWHSTKTWFKTQHFLCKRQWRRWVITSQSNSWDGVVSVSVQNPEKYPLFEYWLHKFLFVESPCVLYARENQGAFCTYFTTIRKLRRKPWKPVQHWCNNCISLPHLYPKPVLSGDLHSSNSEVILINYITLPGDSI